MPPSSITAIGRAASPSRSSPSGLLGCGASWRTTFRSSAPGTSFAKIAESQSKFSKVFPMTDEIDSFAEACAKADAAAANADNSNSGPTPELTNEVVINLAGLTPLQYAQQLAREAKKYKTPVKLLEKAVEAAKIQQEAEKLLEPHWEVKPAEDPVDAAKLFAEIEARILLHVAMPKHLAFVVAMWVGQSWIHEQATYSPILFVTSPERDSGKSTLMGIIGFLVRRSLLSVGISAAALYRSIEKWHPSFVIDECDEAFVDNPELRQVINSGWTRGQGVVQIGRASCRERV